MGCSLPGPTGCGFTGDTPRPHSHPVLEVLRAEPLSNLPGQGPVAPRSQTSGLPTGLCSNAESEGASGPGPASRPLSPLFPFRPTRPLCHLPQSRACGPSHFGHEVLALRSGPLQHCRSPRAAKATGSGTQGGCARHPRIRVLNPPGWLSSRALPSCSSSPFAGVGSGPSPLHGVQTASFSPTSSKIPSLPGFQTQPAQA